MYSDFFKSMFFISGQIIFIPITIIYFFESSLQNVVYVCSLPRIQQRSKFIYTAITLQIIDKFAYFPTFIRILVSFFFADDPFFCTYFQSQKLQKLLVIRTRGQMGGQPNNTKIRNGLPLSLMSMNIAKLFSEIPNLRVILSEINPNLGNQNLDLIISNCNFHDDIDHTRTRLSTCQFVCLQLRKKA